MSYLNVFLTGIVGGLLIGFFIPEYLSKRRDEKEPHSKNEVHSHSNEEPLATKEDVVRLEKEIDELKILYKNIKVETQNEENVVEAEKEFYESIAGE